MKDWPHLYEAYRYRQKKEKGYYTCCSEAEFNEVIDFILVEFSAFKALVKWLRGYLK